MATNVFQLWYSWAVSQAGEGWREVAENAKRPARYEQPQTMREFQEAIGRVPFPQTPEAFNERCRPFHLRGEIVSPDVLPTHLTRMTSVVQLVKSATAEYGGVPPATGTNPTRPARRPLGSGTGHRGRPGREIAAQRIGNGRPEYGRVLHV